MTGFKLKLKVDTSKLKKLVAQKQKLIQKNILTILRKEAFPFLIERIMSGYDQLSDVAEMEPDDPTNPGNWRVEFLNKLEEDLERSFVITGGRISIKLGDKEFLGYDPSGSIDSNDTEPLHWMVFFIEGLIGDWAFITPAVYERLTGRKYQPGWGRFEQGFMISKEEYKENGWHKILAFEDVRHPFSGFRPLDIFAEAVDEFRLRPFIQKAIDVSLRGKKL